MALIPAMVYCQLILAQHATDTVFTHVEAMPIFGDCSTSDDPKKCSDRAIVQFISQHLKYPDEAKANQVEGTVYVNFVVNESGTISSPTLLVDIGSGCGEAAIDVVKAMPQWEPGTQAGQPVSVRLNLPIQFSLRNVEGGLSEQFSITWGDIVSDTVTIEQLRRNLPFNVYVRGAEGDTKYVDELTFLFTLRNKRPIKATSRGDISQELVELTEKAKPAGIFAIHASIQEEGRFIKVERNFYISD